MAPKELTFHLNHEVLGLAGKAGIGHVMALRNIEAALKETPGLKFHSYPYELPGLVDRVYEGVLRTMPERHTFLYGFTDTHPRVLEPVYMLLARLTESGLKEKIKEMEVVIITHPFFIPILEHFGWQGKLVVDVLEMKDNHAAYFRKIGGRWADKYLSVNISKEIARRNLGLPEEGIHLTVSLGGGRTVNGSKNDIIELCRIVEKLQMNGNVYIDLACGRNTEALEYYKRLKVKYSFLNPLEWLDWDNGQMMNLLRAGDLRVCTSIATVSLCEGWAARLPVLVGPLQAQERQYAVVVEEKQIGKAYNTSAELEEQLTSFIDNPRSWVEANARNVLNGLPDEYRHAPERIRKAVEDLFLV